MPVRHPVESYKFWDVVALWSEEQDEPQEIIARILAKGIVREGLRLNSTEILGVRRRISELELKGQPFVGFCATPGSEMSILRVSALQHLLAVARQARGPSRNALRDEFILKEDFHRWLRTTRRQLPAFWFARSDGAV